MTNTVLFDLGNTLVRYYFRTDIPAVLEESIAEVEAYLRRRDSLYLSPEVVRQRMSEENHEAADHRVRPLAGRLARIFQLDPPSSDDLITAMCRAFLRPIFARGYVYEDSLPVLQELRSRGLRTAIVSNSPWGSPADLWREEIRQRGLYDLVDAVVLCGEVGWRKPARQIFDHTLQELQAGPEECLFVGDDPRWDLVGPRAVGIEAVLIDRRGTWEDTGEPAIRSLRELSDVLLSG